MPKTAKKKVAKKAAKKKKKKAVKKEPVHYWYRVETIFGPKPPKDVKVGQQIGMPYSKGKEGSYTIVNSTTGNLVWGFSGTYVGRKPEVISA